MSAIRIISLFFAFFEIINACQPTGKSAEQSPVTEQTDSCLSHPAHTYEVFIPAHNKAETGLPLLVAVDSHGSGQMAVAHLKEAVSTYPAILIASNLIQNNDPNYIKELDELIADVKNRYPVGKETYMIGFSGGARMVLGYAASHRVNGAIACSAFAGPEQLAAIKCPVTGIIGMDDFNFTEMVQYILQPNTTPQNVHIELSQSSHEWPSKEKLTSVFGWYSLSAKSGRKVNRKQIAEYSKEQQLHIDSLVQTGELLQAVCIGRNMASVEVFDKAGSFHPATQKLISQAAYREQLTQLNQSLQFEGQMRQYYSQTLFSKDKNWWEKEITTLHQSMDSEPNIMKQMAYKRLSGFIGIICYSYTRQLAEQKDVKRLEQILMVYRLAEPENTEMKRYYEVLEKLKIQQ